MTMLGILLGASIILMTVAYTLKKAALAFGAAIIWIVFTVHCYGMSGYSATGIWDIYYGLVWLGVGMVLLCVLEPAVMKQRNQDKKEDVFVDDLEKVEKEYEGYRRQTRLPRLGRDKYTK